MYSFSSPFSDLNITFGDTEDSDHCLFYTSLILPQKTWHINTIQKRSSSKWYASNENKNLYMISHSPAWCHPWHARTRQNVHREVRVVENGCKYGFWVNHNRSSTTKGWDSGSRSLRMGLKEKGFFFFYILGQLF